MAAIIARGAENKDSIHGAGSAKTLPGRPPALIELQAPHIAIEREGVMCDHYSQTPPLYMRLQQSGHEFTARRVQVRIRLIEQPQSGVHRQNSRQSDAPALAGR